jgi:hypothetical protein
MVAISALSTEVVNRAVLVVSSQILAKLANYWLAQFFLYVILVTL